MNVTRWKTPAAFFPWPHVQDAINRIDAQVYHGAIDIAQELFLLQAKPCSQCATPPKDLFWFCVTDPEAAWDAGTGRVGFLTLCKRCRCQVDFLIDPELTAMQADQWRQCRTLA